METIIRDVEKAYLNDKEVPFNVGDSISVSFKIH